MSARVIAVIVNWNGREETLACLASLSRATPAPTHTIVVDNGSHDDSVAAVQAAFPAVEVLALPGNRHFAAGANAGLRRALARDAGYLWLLNNDLTVEARALATLIAAAEESGAGIVGPRVRTPQGLDEVGAWWDFDGGRILPAFAGEAGLEAATLPVDYVWGCAMLIHVSVFRAIGLLDERYVAYFEDADFCMRARKAGFQTVAATGALVWHEGSRSAARRPVWQTWRRAMGRLRFYWTYARPAQRPGLVARTVLREWPLLFAGMARRYRLSAEEDEICPE